ncbi:dolichyl-diphosphooligosaccharide--protein glycosyltransferase subunit DAD1 isoform X1 [Gossypium australe]|uniref:Dolichyl-diphosphooligosaccharide--protein glycosyltransferase subunit DAD1 isoform X1 n=1 Tax=Gossypium australe TaxID=47621 RepID=A0A5B6UEZ6_9ROSI|nr:dolichyl-diphosphooligosaccharide--protein glycosyltransferase subunit DAD1 isoform X1 [Gossypium australe]
MKFLGHYYEFMHIAYMIGNCSKNSVIRVTNKITRQLHLACHIYLVLVYNDKGDKGLYSTFTVLNANSNMT